MGGQTTCMLDLQKARVRNFKAYFVHPIRTKFRSCIVWGLDKSSRGRKRLKLPENLTLKSFLSRTSKITQSSLDFRVHSLRLDSTPVTKNS